LTAFLESRSPPAAVAFLAAALAFGPATAQAPACADIALVLAVDASGSIDDAEHRLQVEGLAAAFRDPEVLAALDAAGTVLVAAIFWGEKDKPRDILGWHPIRDRFDAARFAALLEGRPRVAGGMTHLGAALDAALDLLAAPGVCAGRAVINVSGDGRETGNTPWYRGDPVAMPRARAAQTGVTVNGLAILSDEPDLRDYYQRHVITGPGAFVMEIRGLPDFAEAIRRKIIREIGRPLLASAD
jgi:Ca-activated chloride channel homolog